MLFDKNNKTKDIRPTINFLLYKWQQITRLAALEKTNEVDQLYILQKLNSLGLKGDVLTILSPLKRLGIIKNEVSKIVPGSSFIKTNYDPGMDLGPEDFIELFIEHECILMQRITMLMKGKISNG